MEFTKRQQQFIIKAHDSSEVCASWTQEIKELFPKLFPKREYTKSGWYITTCCNKTGCLCFFTNPKGELNGEYWLSEDGQWMEGGLFDEIERPATDKEVEKALIKEAKRRGLKEGAAARDVDGDIGIIKNINYCKDSAPSNGLWSVGDLHLFHKGKWAEIIQTITKEEAEKELGKTIVG